MEKIHLVSVERGQKVYLKGISEKVTVTFNKYKALSFETVEEAQAVVNIANRASKRTFSVAIESYFKDLETLKVNIDDNKIKIILGLETLLFTKNSVWAYHKLIKTIESVEALNFKLWVENEKVFEIESKEEFILAIVDFLSN